MNRKCEKCERLKARNDKQADEIIRLRSFAEENATLQGENERLKEQLSKEKK